MLPAFLHFGMANGVRYAMALLMLVSVLAINPIINVWIKPEAAPQVLRGITSLAASPESFIAAAGILVVAAFALYAASCAGSLAICRRRDF